MVTSASQIFGKIGAAKSFDKVANALDMEIGANSERIDEQQTRLQDQTLTADERRAIERSIKRLDKKNKMLDRYQKQSSNATEFLSKLADKVGIGMDVLINWMSKFIVVAMPGLEVSIKMLLLSNIKKMVGCSIDPMIPDQWRLEGVTLNEAQVDPRRILRFGPYSQFGKFQYFGCYDEGDYTRPKNTSELARADDMNAFLWYAKNCAKFVSPIVIAPSEMGNYFVGADSGTTFYNTHEFTIKSNARKYINGTSFKNFSDSPTTFLLEHEEENRYTILPATDDFTGITWYKDRDVLTGFERKYKDYNRSKPLFNISFLGNVDNARMYRNGNFKFRILPKPFSTAGGFVVDLYNSVNNMASVAGSSVSKELVGEELVTDMPRYQYQGIQSPIPYYARFNGNGDYDRSGRYSINMRQYDVIKIPDNTNKVIQYGIYRISGSNPVAYLYFNKQNKTFTIGDLNSSPANVSKAGQDIIASVLGECYCGNTVYEFNYDYVMSMKLFDAKAVTASVINSLLDIKFKINLQDLNPFLKGGDVIDNEVLSDTDQIYIDSYVDRLIEKMIDTEEKEYTDCFYTFSNEDYEAMERQTYDKVYNMALDIDNAQGAITAIYDELDAYDADASLEERTETIEKAILGAVAACGYNDSNGLPETEETRGRYRSSGLANAAGERSGLFQMIKTILEVLVSAIVNAILTPKVLMLIQVNRMMMMQNAISAGRVDETYSVKDVLNGMSGMIKGVIREIVDTIHRELLRMILERLSEIMAAYIKKLGIEYAMKWVNILKSLLACFNTDRSAAYAEEGGNTIYRGTINSIIDEVNYADLEILADEIIPNTNPC